MIKPVFAVVIEGAHEEFGSGGGREVDIDDVHILLGAESGQQSHSLARAWGTAQHQGLVLGQPRGQQHLVSDRVDRGHNQVRGSHAVRLDVDLRYFREPRLPVARLKDNFVVDYAGLQTQRYFSSFPFKV